MKRSLRDKFFFEKNETETRHKSKMASALVETITNNPNSIVELAEEIAATIKRQQNEIIVLQHKLNSDKPFVNKIFKTMQIEPEGRVVGWLEGPIFESGSRVPSKKITPKMIVPIFNFLGHLKSTIIIESKHDKEKIGWIMLSQNQQVFLATEIPDFESFRQNILDDLRIAKNNFKFSFGGVTEEIPEIKDPFSEFRISLSGGLIPTDELEDSKFCLQYLMDAVVSENVHFVRDNHFEFISFVDGKIYVSLRVFNRDCTRFFSNFIDSIFDTVMEFVSVHS
jgi:hypothetical protein